MIRVRFAAKPTGYLHIGTARVALTNFLFARRHAGHLLLRFDDIDREGLKPELAETIAQDLRWLGIEWDDGFHQSDRMALYHAAAAERLKQSGRLYPCLESEAELRAKRDHRIKRGLPPIYDRAMLKLTSAQRAAAEAGGKRPHWRFHLSDRSVEWRDLVLGHRLATLDSLSDPVLLRANGTPLSTFTSVVDDIATGISHVIRGEDDVTITAIQIDLLAALGAEAHQPSFAHLPLLVEDAGGRRIDRITLRGLRNDGIESNALAAYLARLGTDAEPPPSPTAELAEDFDLGRFSRSNVPFDATRLLSLNRRVLQTLPFAAVAERLPSGATEAFWLVVRGALDLLSEARGWWDVVAGTIVPPVIEGEQQFLHTALEALPPEPWNRSVWTTWTDAIERSTGRKSGAILPPLRLALTGEDQGPDLHDLLPLIGRARAADRLRIAAP
jgi:glutamyl-tRNA synthetase